MSIKQKFVNRKAKLIVIKLYQLNLLKNLLPFLTKIIIKSNSKYEY